MSVIGRESSVVSQHTDLEEGHLMAPEDQIRIAVNAQAELNAGSQVQEITKKISK